MRVPVSSVGHPGERFQDLHFQNRTWMNLQSSSDNLFQTGQDVFRVQRHPISMTVYRHRLFLILSPVQFLLPSTCGQHLRVTVPVPSPESSSGVTQRTSSYGSSTRGASSFSHTPEWTAIFNLRWLRIWDTETGAPRNEQSTSNSVLNHFWKPAFPPSNPPQCWGSSHKPPKRPSGFRFPIRMAPEGPSKKAAWTVSSRTFVRRFFTGRSAIVPAVRDAQSIWTGHSPQDGFRGVHTIAPNSIKAWL